MSLDLTVTVQENRDGVDVSSILEGVGLQLKKQVGLSLFQCEMDLDSEANVPALEIKQQLEGTAEGLKVTVLDGKIAW